MLLGKACVASEIALPHELLQEASIGGPIRKLPAAADPQGLIDRLLEAEVRLLDVTILVGDPDIVGRRFHPVVGHQRGVARRRLMPAFAIERLHRGAEVIGPMLLRHAADLPERHFDPFGQCLETLRQDQMHRFDIRKDQHEMKEQMREGNPGEGDAEIGQMGEV